MLFLGKFSPNNQNCKFKLKLGTYTNSNMQNSMVMFTFSYPNLVRKIKLTSVNMQNSMVIGAFSVLDQNYLFWLNLIKKLKLSARMKFGTESNSNMQNSAR